MPHIRLEYTGNISIEFKFDDLFHQVHQILNEIAGIKMENCKSRAILLHDYYIGDGEKAAFIHLDVSFLEGRSVELKKEIGTQLLSLLKKFFKNPGDARELQITVEIHDIRKAFYFKDPPGSLKY